MKLYAPLVHKELSTQFKERYVRYFSNNSVYYIKSTNDFTDKHCYVTLYGYECNAIPDNATICKMFTLFIAI